MLILPILAVLAATPATWAAQLKAAQPGDTLVLTGAFPTLSIQSKTGLTVDATKASLTGVNIKASSGLRWRGGVFTPPAGWSGAIYASSSNDLTFDAVRIYGDPGAPGLTFRSGAGLKLTNSYIQRARVGISLDNAQDVEVTAVTVAGFAIDGLDIASSRRVTVQYSAFVGGLLDDAHHPDGIQLWTKPGGVKTGEVTIRYNVFQGWSQGSSMFVHDPTLNGDHIVMEGNFYALGYPNAAWLNDATDSAIRGNVVHTLPGASFQARIYAPQAGDPGKVLRCGNTVAAVPGKAGVTDAPCAP